MTNGKRQEENNDFYLFYDGPEYKPFWQEVSVESETYNMLGDLMFETQLGFKNRI